MKMPKRLIASLGVLMLSATPLLHASADQRDDHDRALRRPWGGFPPSPRSNKKLDFLLDSKLRRGIAVSGQRVSWDFRARSPEAATPEIPIPFAPEVPIASTTPSTGPVDKLIGRMSKRS